MPEPVFKTKKYRKESTQGGEREERNEEKGIRRRGGMKREEENEKRRKRGGGRKKKEKERRRKRKGEREGGEREERGERRWEKHMRRVIHTFIYVHIVQYGYNLTIEAKFDCTMQKKCCQKVI